MNLHRSLASAALLLLIAAATATASQRSAAIGNTPLKTDQLAALRGLLDSGIVMLQNQEYVAFLERFVNPDQRAEVLEDRTMAEQAERFKGERADVLLNVLKQIRNKKPRMDTRANTATYKLAGKDMPRKTITFKLFDGVWYLVN